MISVRGPDGIEYESLSAAARALGVHITTIRDHLRRYGNLDLIGCQSVPCVWKGRTYLTVAACARAAGLSRNTVSFHLNKYGNLDRLGTYGIGNPGNRGNRKPFCFGSLTWPTHRQAASDLGISPETLTLWSGPKASARQRDKLMATVMAFEARGRKAAA